MASLEEAYRRRWFAVRSETTVGPYHHSFGIPTFWRAHPELGSPITKEMDLDSTPGGKVQVFTGGIVQWLPDQGASLVAE